MSPSTPTLRGELLYRMSLEVAPPLDLGATPQGRRLLFAFKGGRFEGPGLAGEVLTTGGDWLIDRPDGAMVLDVRRTLRTNDGHFIYAFYRGLLLASPAVRQKMERGEPVAADHGPELAEESPEGAVAAGAPGGVGVFGGEVELGRFLSAAGRGLRLAGPMAQAA